MTVLLPLTRALSKQILLNSGKPITRLSSSLLLRVLSSSKKEISATKPNQGSPLNVCFLGQARSYATGTAPRPAGRPKAHTGRTRTPRKTTTTTQKSAPKKRATTRRTKKPTATKPKRKRVLTKAGQAKKAAQARTELRKTALLNGAPKKLPETAWSVMITENPPQKGRREDGSTFRALSTQYKSIPSEELERLNHTANSNKALNDSAYKKWLGTHSPAEVRAANNARHLLNKGTKANGRKKHYQNIKDDRLVKQPINSYAFFIKDRFASGDFHRMAIGEAGKLVGREWKDLSASQKKPYQDQAQLDHARYLEEHKTVYGTDLPSKTRTTRVRARA